MARRIVAIMNVKQLTKLPTIRVHLRPTRSMKAMQRASAIKAKTELMAWYLSVSFVEMPI